MSEQKAPALLSLVQRILDVELIHTDSFRGDDTIVVNPADILVVMNNLKENPETDFSLMMDLTAVDYLNDRNLQPYMAGLKARFEVVYHLYSLGKNHRLRVKAPVGADNPEINSITTVWPGADWFEREVWDLYGIKFLGHPDLRRILLYEEFEGHPLRKDYGKEDRQPLIGPRN